MPRPGKQRPVSGRKIDPVAIVSRVCALYGDRGFVQATSQRLIDNGVAAAVRDRDTARLYDYLMDCFSYQGVSNAAASSYLEQHGNATHEIVALALASGASVCPKLQTFDAFTGCGYVKSQGRCNNPSALARCPVPRHELRKGALNQAAYSLALFLRDKAAGGDLVGYIDGVLERADRPGHPDRIALMRRALMGELVLIYGVSLKVLNMTFANLLMGGDLERVRWFETGSSMIAVDTLVHNFLHRTGIHHLNRTDHAYGPACYGPGGCEAIIDGLAREIDARQFNPGFPTYFPRFIQHAIWRFCSEDRVGICNGRAIDDSRRCRQRDCPVFSICGRVALRPRVRPARSDVTEPRIATP